ncbi:MAG TPA: S8 family serine peptidase [Bacillota bacterium]|nr:S8 family serine peptidase [Bacillota bacterium]
MALRTNEIVLLDDGINESVYQLTRPVQSIEITKHGIIKERNKYNPNQASHGTICAAIIQTYAPGAAVHSVKILDENTRGFMMQLVRGIRWCMDSGFKLINLSLGSIHLQDYPVMQKIVNEAYRQGLIIVAACSNKNLFTYPASLENVIGVRCDSNELLQQKEYYYHICPDDGIEITANGAHCLRMANGREEKLYPANSYATPLITAKVYHFLKRYPEATLEEVKKYLYQNAVNYNPRFRRQLKFTRSIDWVHQAILYCLRPQTQKYETMPIPGYVQNYIEIPCQTIFEGLLEVLEQRPVPKGGVKPEESVIIVIKKGLVSTDPIREKCLLNRIARLRKNLVWINEDTRHPHLELTNVPGSTRKIWQSSFLESENPDILEPEELDIPLIICYNLIPGSTFPDCQIAEFFKEDGYRVLQLTDQAAGILLGWNYAPLYHFYERNHAFNDYLPKLNRIYAPDLMILAVNADGRELPYIEGIQQRLRPDINLYFTIQAADVSPYVFKNAPESRNIIISQLMKQKFLDQSGHIPIFHFQRPRKIYKYLIKLFQQDQLNQQV